MWTGLKENCEYSAQITPYRGKVYAEIIRRDRNKGFYEHTLGLWLTVSDKSFGSMFRSAPTEKDWQKATDWVEQQLNLIEKYGTVMVTQPEHIRNVNMVKNAK